MLEDVKCETYTEADGSHRCRTHDRELVDRKTLESIHDKVDKPWFDGRVYCPVSGKPFKF
jgi:hypothetical protein